MTRLAVIHNKVHIHNTAHIHNTHPQHSAHPQHIHNKVHIHNTEHIHNTHPQQSTRPQHNTHPQQSTHTQHNTHPQQSTHMQHTSTTQCASTTQRTSTTQHTSPPALVTTPPMLPTPERNEQKSDSQLSAAVTGENEWWPTKVTAWLDSRRLDRTFCPTWGGWWGRRCPARCTGCPPPGRQCPGKGSCPQARMSWSVWCSSSLQTLSQGSLPQTGGIRCEWSASMRKTMLVWGKLC